MIFKRGNPDHDEKIVHMYKKQYRGGLREGQGSHCDYPPAVICGHGGYHILYSDNKKQVNCPKCKEKIS